MTRNFTLSVTRRAAVTHEPVTMKLVYVTLVVLLCIVIQIQSEKTRSGLCKGCEREEYIRIKRAKYYSHPPLRFYNRPPMVYPIKGAFSFTPPPGYQMDDARQPLNSKLKVSSNRPTNEGVGDDEINNIMRFLSKQDLNKIVELANEKDREQSKYSTDSFYEGPNYVANREEKYENKVMNNNYVSELDNDNKFVQNGPFLSAHHDFRPYSIEYNNPNINELKETKPFRFSELGPSALFINENQMRLNTQPDAERVTQSQLFSNLNLYAHEDFRENKDGANIFNIDSKLTQEEQLPKPTNLRDVFEVSYTNNVPTVVKANSNSYKIENLGSLPLMNYHSKLESVDSYKVPHYTVTSPEKHRVPAHSGTVPVEAAPPASTAQQQSDAHLKAIKIWTHKSKGTAYTLHDDGTLSLEKPLRLKPNLS